MLCKRHLVLFGYAIISTNDSHTYVSSLPTCLPCTPNPTGHDTCCGFLMHTPYEFEAQTSPFPHIAATYPRQPLVQQAQLQSHNSMPQTSSAHCAKTNHWQYCSNHTMCDDQPSLKIAVKSCPAGLPPLHTSPNVFHPDVACSQDRCHNMAHVPALHRSLSAALLQGLLQSRQRKLWEMIRIPNSICTIESLEGYST